MFRKILNITKITESGVWFEHNGDEVLYVFPWARIKKENKYLSLGFMCYFSSLEEIDEFWKGYFEAIKE